MASRLHRYVRLVAGIACALLLLALAPPAGPVRAAPPLVTNCLDSGAGSLRAAIAAAASVDTIRFQAGLSCPSASPIRLTSGTLTLAKNLTIDGTGATIAVDGNNAVSVFVVSSGANVAINTLTIQHGKGGNGGIGGGIYNVDGTLTVTNSTLSGNVAPSDAGGGLGGGIFNGGTLTVTSSTFSGNSAAIGGGIENYDGFRLTVTSSTFSANSASLGGGIYNGDGSGLTVTSSTFADNAADGGGLGGGIYNTGTLTATSSTFSGNHADGGGLGGGIVNSGALTTTNSTFAGNHADGGSGGGIYNRAGTLTATSSTFAGNSASALGGGGIDNRGGATLTNAIVATSPTGGDLAGTYGGSNNLIDDASGTLTGTGNIRNTPALLGTLGSNGGPTQTIPLLLGSPAINAGAAVGSGPAGNPVPATDQRGTPRVGAPDIGAFESAGTTATATATTLASSANPATVGQSVTFTATVTGSGGTPTGTVAFKDGATTLGTGTLAAGVATFSTGTLAQGSHTITAVYSGDATFATSTSAVLTEVVNPTGGPSPTTGLQFYPLAQPVRLLDTRPGATAFVHPDAALTAGQTLALPGQFTANGVTIPAAAQAVVGNATVANGGNGTPAGFATIFPSGVSLPLTSNLNFVPGTVRPNEFTVALGADGKFNLYSSTGGDFVVDISGYYAPVGAGGLYFHPLSAPVRELDTRGGATAFVHPSATLAAGQTVNLPGSFSFAGVTVPAGAKALVGNATVANDSNGTPAGFATLYPNGVSLPLASNLNFVPGTVAPNAFTVALGGDGTYNLYSSTGGDFIVDITGYLDTVAAGGLLFTPLAAPVRELDTRAGATAFVHPNATSAAGQTVNLPGSFSFAGVTVPAGTKALVGNATVANDGNTTPAGFATLFPGGVPLPLASNLNFVPKQVAPNAIIVGIGSDGTYNLYSSSGGDFVIDITGYFSASAVAGSTPAKVPG